MENGKHQNGTDYTGRNYVYNDIHRVCPVFDSIQI